MWTLFVGQKSKKFIGKHISILCYLKCIKQGFGHALYDGKVSIAIKMFSFVK